MPSSTALEAERLWQSGERESGERAILAERRRAMREGDTLSWVRAEIVIARFALEIDDDARAEAALAARPRIDEPHDVRLEVWCIESQLGRRKTKPSALPFPDSLDLPVREGEEALAVEVGVERAAGARSRGSRDEALSCLAAAARHVVPGTRGAALVELERAEGHIAEKEWNAASVNLREALTILDDLPFVSLRGRTLLRCGEAVGAGMPDNMPAAAWLALAETTLGSLATVTDRARLRAGFRRFGRRLPDPAMTDVAMMRLDSLASATASTRTAVAVALDAADRALGTGPDDPEAVRRVLDALPGSLSALHKEVDRGTSDLRDYLAGALLERNRTRSLLVAMAELDGRDTPGELARAASQVARTVIDADAVVVVRHGESGIDLLGNDGPAAHPLVDPERWEQAARRALGGVRESARPPPIGPDPKVRGDTGSLGAQLVLPMMSSTFEGVLIADRSLRAGEFTESDGDLGRILAQYLAQAFSRLSAREAERLALAELGATLDAVREGVISVDRAGVIRSINAAAVRMLGIGNEPVVGRSLEGMTGLESLRALLVPARRVDGSVARTAEGSVVVTSRSIDESGAGGAVATLVELDRARQMAVRVSGVRPRYGFQDVVGVSPGVQEAVRIGRQIAAASANVLITGETGTGKEVFAQAIHTAGPCETEPFVGINCAALPRELLEGELFGYERGAFTGARNEGAVGKFELAGEGTLLLDEIGDMPLDMQAKLLRVLQERVVVRLGGSRERPVRARIIATTHRPLEEAAARGAFRQDLFFRLRVLHVHLPPLRERSEDIEPLALRFLTRTADAQSKRVRTIGRGVADVLKRHDWPGNIRELANVIEREVSLLESHQTELDRLHTPLSGVSILPTLRPFGEVPPPSPSSEGRAILPMAEVERRAFFEALEICGGHVARAAKALGVSTSSFYAKLKQWGVPSADERAPESLRRIARQER